MVRHNVKAPYSNNSNQNIPTYTFNENLNVDFLRNTYGDNLPYCHKMFSIFLSTIESDLTGLRRALQQEDYLELQLEAQKIKNNFTWVGLPQLSKMMHDIENMARVNAPDLIPKMELLIVTYQKCRTDIENEYTNLNTYINEAMQNVYFNNI